MGAKSCRDCGSKLEKSGSCPECERWDRVERKREALHPPLPEELRQAEQHMRELSPAPPVVICRHCKRPAERVAVMIPASLSYTGEDRLDIKSIDSCVADIVRKLNAGTRQPVTTSSCCGHGRGPGEILLVDGRRLVVEGI